MWLKQSLTDWKYNCTLLITKLLQHSKPQKQIESFLSRTFNYDYAMLQIYLNV